MVSTRIVHLKTTLAEVVFFFAGLLAKAIRENKEVKRINTGFEGGEKGRRT